MHVDINVSVRDIIENLEKVHAAVREVLAGSAAASFVVSDALPTALACFAVSTVTDFFFYKRCAQPRQLKILGHRTPLSCSVTLDRLDLNGRLA